MNTQIVNLSAEPDWLVRRWLPSGIKAERIVFLPDACPGKSPLPTGTAVLTRQGDWRRFAVSDCGCGMRLLESNVPSADLTQQKWDAVADRLRRNKGGLGDLGGGNHFLDALEPYGGGPLHFLVHTGSRAESGLVDDLIEQPAAFDATFARVVDWATRNREAVANAVDAVFGRCRLVVDLPHNTFEQLDDGSVLIRKGAVATKCGELNVIPSHMAGDVVLVRATDRVAESLDSLSHGTGRAVSRSEAKHLAENFDFAALRRDVLLPTDLADASLRTDGPFAYRDLDACLTLLDGFVEEEQRFRVVGFMGHL